MKILFPEYLNKGSKGPAVLLLQLLLKAMGYNKNIIADGDYGEETALGVKTLQSHLLVEVDGNFGPTTRAKWLERGGPDVNAITVESLLGETIAVGP